MNVRTLVSLTLAVTTLVLVAPLGCGDESAATTGRRVTLELRARGSAGATKPFTTTKGFRLTLTKALLATGATTYYDGATIFSGARPRRPPGLLQRLAIKSAFAHPGHYVPGAARGEVLTPSSIDLTQEAPLGSGEGTSGIVRSATFSFGAPPAGPQAALLTGNVALLEGTAEKDGVVHAFRAEVSADEVRNGKGGLDIEGCPFAETDLQTDGVVTLTVGVEAWLDNVDFGSVPAGTTPTLLPAEGLAKNQLTRGMKAATPYSFSFAPR